MIESITDAVGIPMLVAINLPIGMVFFYKRSKNVSLWCFAVGAICFVLFATVLESLLHSVMIAGTTEISKKILASPALYTLYGALAAGIFEETGRLFGFKVLLRNHNENACPVAYGMGHAGIEIILTLGVTYVMLAAVQVGTVIGTESNTAQLLATANSLTLTDGAFAIFERISAVMLHIGLSMVMFVACRCKGMLRLWPAAIALHALADVPAALYQTQVIRSLYVVEAPIFLLGAACLVFGKRLMDKYIGSEPAEPAGEALPEPPAE